MPRVAPTVPARSPTDPRQRFGLAGEQAVITYLVRQGWHIEAHRFRVGRQEIDVVARRERLVAFVEVKARHGQRYGAPAEAVGWRKRRTIAQVASVWALRHGRWGDVYRFDVVEVVPVSGGRARLHHIQDAWRL